MDIVIVELPHNIIQRNSPSSLRAAMLQGLETFPLTKGQEAKLEVAEWRML